MQRMKHIVFAVFLSGSSVVFAQETVRQDTSLAEYAISPIVVTATRTSQSIQRVPRAMDVIEGQRFKTGTQSLSFDEFLATIPGVFVNNRFNLSQGDRITIRGIGSRAQFGVRGIKLILDDIPLTMADGQSQLNNFDFGSAGAVEVIRGPSSSLYGNSSGGVIAMSTESIQSGTFQLQPSFISGSFGHTKWQGKLQGHQNKIRYIANFSHNSINGFRDHSSGEFTTINVVAHFAISEKLQLSTVLNNYDAPYLLNPSSVDKTTSLSDPKFARNFIVQQGAGKRVNSFQSGLTLKHIINNDNSYKATLYGIYRNTDNNIPGRIIELDRKAGGVRFAYTHRSSSIPLRTTAGIDYEFQNDWRNEYENIGLPVNIVPVMYDNEKALTQVVRGEKLVTQNENVDGLGPFFEFEYGIAPNWVVTLGGRYDYFTFSVKDKLTNAVNQKSGKRVMDKFSPVAGILYQAAPNLNVFGNYSTSFQTPTTTELGNRPSGEGGFNPDLQPEVIKNYELGIKGFIINPNLQYDITGYKAALNEMLIPFQTPVQMSEEVFFRNAGKADNRGLEIKIDYIPAKWTRVIFSYTYTDFTFEDFLKEEKIDNMIVKHQLSGKKVPGIAPRRLFTRLNLHDPDEQYFGEITINWVDEYFANDFNGPLPGANESVNDYKNDAYTTIDVRTGFNYKKGNVVFRMFLGADNILDKCYNSSIVPNAFGKRFFEPGAGRSWYGGIYIPFTIP